MGFFGLGQTPAEKQAECDKCAEDLAKMKAPPKQEAPPTPGTPPTPGGDKGFFGNLFGTKTAPATRTTLGGKSRRNRRNSRKNKRRKSRRRGTA